PAPPSPAVIQVTVVGRPNWPGGPPGLRRGAQTQSILVTQGRRPRCALTGTQRSSGEFLDLCGQFSAGITGVDDAAGSSRSTPVSASTRGQCSMPRGLLGRWGRSEEHTSELQSHHDLVCRLLLEKKKKKK